MNLNSVANALPLHRNILVAFSGGLDSTVLLHKLVCWREQSPDVTLRAIHIHHGLSVNADAWTTHCQQVCSEWAVPLEVVKVTLAENGLGVEAHAREARYAAFRASLQPGEVLVTAQHLDDQCETFLLALKRGSGPAGLSAMAVESEFAGTKLLRPLLNDKRDDLERWAVANALRWIEDESNQDDRYDRNFLRLRVLPQLTDRWPHFAEAAARSAALCGEQEQLLDELLANELAALTGTQGQLAIEPLLKVSDIRRAALLRRWLAQRQATMPSRTMLERIWQEVALAREDANPLLQVDPFEIRRYQQQLWLIPAYARQSDMQIAWPDTTQPLLLPGSSALHLVAGTEIRAPNEDERVSVRFTASGNLHIVGRNGGRKLKKIWQELGVAPWLRDTTPLLFYGETLIAAAGYFVTVEGQFREGSEGLAFVRQRKGQ
ncbi:MAG TPA: tRNA lysidine(34) synthetase TilS [Scandinavium sp.]|jgi:tRNA(Ile)-lysidine synthase|uniref:tRNA lysidine(34) synthetase TilS n=1 Tax=Scandinavium sp. TaxID=2830653 RepID=UPI002E312312|nr:tRNA lysidine(34) synthetase TilS [Scandinavium sp.]HEX4499979.1 tRNA lysidine(34) synthetase TilS [Scandinavium sp.]